MFCLNSHMINVFVLQHYQSVDRPGNMLVLFH